MDKPAFVSGSTGSAKIYSGRSGARAPALRLHRDCPLNMKKKSQPQPKVRARTIYLPEYRYPDDPRGHWRTVGFEKYPRWCFSKKAALIEARKSAGLLVL